MTHIKLPVYLACDGQNWVVLDAEHTSLCYVAAHRGGAAQLEAIEIIAALNAHGDLLAACNRVYNDTGWCPVCDPHEHSADCVLAKEGQ